MSWWTKKVKSIGKTIAKASQTKVGKLVTGQSFLEGVSDGMQKMGENITNPLGAIQNMMPGFNGSGNNVSSSSDSSNTQPLANPTPMASENSGASGQTEQGVKNVTGSSDNPGKYSAVNNGGIHYGL